MCARARALQYTLWERTIVNTESIIHNLRRATRETVTKLAPCIICPRRYSWRTYVVQLRVSSAFCTNRTYIYIYIDARGSSWKQAATDDPCSSSVSTRILYTQVQIYTTCVYSVLFKYQYILPLLLSSSLSLFFVTIP